MREKTQPICKHFPVCGGCRFQDIDYEKQLLRKEDFLKEVFSSLNEPFSLMPIVASPQIYFYRNKMEFSFAGEGKDLICGLHSKFNKREIVDIQECLIFSENASLILENVKDFFRKRKASSYSILSQQGFLRYLVLREAKKKKNFMVNIVTSQNASLDREEFRDHILSLKLKDKEITSLIWTRSDTLSDAVVPQSWEVLYGDDFLLEEVKGFSFRVPPFSFFQVNPLILENFFEFIEGILPSYKEERALDLFSGIGTQSLILAEHFYFVWAVEQDREAVQAALINASLNNFKNVSFLNSDVRKALFLNLNSWRGSIFLVFINPPRAGLSRKIIERIKKILPTMIIYSSCNPKSLVSDLKEFLDLYTIELVQPFDFFPHTPHIEVLALLKQR